MEEIIRRIEERIISHQEFLNEQDRVTIKERKYLDEESPERAYWHYGYLVALRDVSRLLRKDSL